MKSRKIAIILNEMIYGGTGQHVVLLAKGLVRNGHGLEVYFPDVNTELKNKLIKTGASIVPLPMKKVFSFNAFKMAKRALQRFQPQIIHIHGNEAGFVGHLLAMATGVAVTIYTPHIIYIRNNYKRFINSILWQVCRWKPDKVIAVSNSAYRSLASGERGVKVPESKLVVILNEIDPELMEELSGQEPSKAVKGECPIIGQAGRFVFQKGPVDFVKTAVLISKQIPASRFLMIGDGPMRKEVEALIHSSGMGDKFILTGHCSNPFPLMKQMSVGTMFSRWEGMQYVLLEYLYFGVIPVAYDIPGIKEVVSGLENELLVHVGDHEAAAEKIIFLLNTENLIKIREIKEKCKNLSIKYSNGSMVNRVMELYEQSLSEKEVI